MYCKFCIHANDSPKEKGKNWRKRSDDESESNNTGTSIRLSRKTSTKNRQNIEVVTRCRGVVDMVFRVVLEAF